MMNVIQMDTREKIAKKEHITAYFEQCGIKYIRSKMYVGDYSRLDNQTVCIDVKQNLQEVYSNVISDHERFKNECKRAQDVGIRLIILIEEPKIKHVENVKNWVNPRNLMWKRGKLKGQRKAPVSSAALQTAMLTLTARYGVEWRFCEPDDTGKTICTLLGVPHDKESVRKREDFTP